MAITQEQLDALDAALASGELTVSYQGRSVSYRSVEELLRARRTLQDEFDRQNSGRSDSQRLIPRYQVFSMGDGWP